MKVVIVLPTYNEAENIEKILGALMNVGQEIRPEIFDFGSYDLQVLVVDDQSPDGTQQLVEGYKSKNKAFEPLIHLLSGKKQGLGAAYIRGIKQALVKYQADVVVQMDADFSHDPQILKDMLKRLREGADFVIGSRYVKGGSIPSEWRLWRKLNSWCGNMVARLVAGLYGVRDCTSGYRAIKSTLLDQINLDVIRTQGYGFQVSLLYEAFINDAHIVETPIQFIDRTAGESKLGLKDIIEFIANAFAIRLRGSRTFIKFLSVGVSGVAVNLGIFSLLINLEWGQYLASLLAIELSIIWNFILNNLWTFNERRVQNGLILKGIFFNVVSLLTLGVSFTTFLILTLAFPSSSSLFFQGISIIPAALLNYFLNSYFVFKNISTDP